MLTATCHCGAVRVEVPRKPRRLTLCNCSICRRYGTLWAYYKTDAVRVVAKRGATESYVWGDKTLRFLRCATCGCVLCWQGIAKPASGRTGVNARNFDPAVIAGLRIRHFDGAKTWRYLD